MKLSWTILAAALALVSACTCRRADESIRRGAIKPSPVDSRVVQSAGAGRQWHLCGELIFQFGDRVRLRPGSLSPGDAVLLIRDSRSLALVDKVTTGPADNRDGRVDGVPIRIIAVAVKACSDDPRTNAAACIQAGRDKVFYFLREMQTAERCDDVGLIMSEMK